MICQTWKEAILKSLDDLHSGTAKEVYKNIAAKGYFNSTAGKTPEATVQAQLGEFIRKGDSRIKRVKNADGVYYYYLTQYEGTLFDTSSAIEGQPKKEKKEKTTYIERDLHPLLCTYLKNINVFAKTIYHEESTTKEDHQKWMHPDIIGVRFNEYENKVCQDLFKTINLSSAVDIYSYELKRKITTDNDLKKYFFQAVSNSSWANYGYLVAFEIGDNLKEELERLNHSFGIGVILLKANPYTSQLLFAAKRREVDFKTVNKLCKANPRFLKFLEQVKEFISAETKYTEILKKEIMSSCDEALSGDSKIEEYCVEKHIPQED